MPRLRIKSTDGRVERLQVPDDCTLQTLKAEVARVVFQQSDPGIVKLSLNKKVQLEGQSRDTLRSLGICSGDTLWLMSSASEAQQLADMSSLTAAQAKSAGEEMARPSAPSYLQRVLDHNQTDITNAHQLLFMALHAVLLETGLQQSQQVQDQYSLPPNVSNSAAKLEYSLQQQPEGPACEVKYISLGSTYACIAATAGNGIATLNIALKDHLDSQLSQASPGSEGKLAAFKQLPQLWTQLKDGLALRLVALLRQKAGLAPLSGLLTLPTDLKIKILIMLQARDLAVLGCSCTELRHTAGSDAFWQVLFKQEFGYAPELDSIQGSSLRWQRLFGRTWLNRLLHLLLASVCAQHLLKQPSTYRQLPLLGQLLAKQKPAGIGQREEMRVKRRHLEMRHARQGRTPYGMPHIPPGPPGLITGGDYDRLPQPFLGGTPGVFGGVLRGGGQFGGQGPRGPPGSMFLGGSRSNGRAARVAGSFCLH